MLRFIVKRILQSFVVIICVSILAFLLIRIAPGNPARMLLPEGATDLEVANMEKELGLDRPLYEQYLKYITGVLKGDLGTSTIYKKPVKDIILGRLPATVKLSLASIVISLAISIPLGIYAGSHQGRIADFLSMLFALFGQSMSPVWLGVLLIYIFSTKLGWLPSLGYGGIKYIILPAFTLGYPIAAKIVRLGRSGMIDTLCEDYITATYAKGINRRQVCWKYAFKNALIPIITLVGLQIGSLLAGTVVVETVFAWPGIGQLTNMAVGNRDYAMVQSLLLCVACIFTFINLIVDIINSFVDPRITLE